MQRKCITKRGTPKCCFIFILRKTRQLKRLLSCKYYIIPVLNFESFNPKNHSLLLQGIEKNVRVLKNLYPGWVMRVYHDVPASDANTTEKLNRLTQQYGDILDTCFVGNLPLHGNMLGMGSLNNFY